MKVVDPAEMVLPASPIPRPGERVRWFAAARHMQGVVVGHDINGVAIVKNDFGPEQHVSFDDIRLETPFARTLPNWHYLPTEGRLLKPEEETLENFRASMARVIAPGPTYRELVDEIWGRGFEVFLVGGTVRDLLAGHESNDVDLVTTMPLERMVGFLKVMFQTNEPGYGKRGYIRLGGRPASGDPFIDLKVFSDALPGTEYATFGVGFERDVAFRDFACNAVYFDPVNEVIIDPTGHGVSDCENRRLRLVKGRHDRHQMGQVFIRAAKFVSRGFEIASETQTVLIDTYLPNVGAMTKELRKRYFHTQVMSKIKGADAQLEALKRFKDSLKSMGCPQAWDEYFAFANEELNDD